MREDDEPFGGLSAENIIPQPVYNMQEEILRFLFGGKQLKDPSLVGRIAACGQPAGDERLTDGGEEQIFRSVSSYINLVLRKHLKELEEMGQKTGKSP